MSLSGLQKGPQILFPAAGWSCVWWYQIQLLHALLIANWSVSYQLGF